jgi:hypothetical protein
MEMGVAPSQAAKAALTVDRRVSTGKKKGEKRRGRTGKHERDDDGAVDAVVASPKKQRPLPLLTGEHLVLELLVKLGRLLLVRLLQSSVLTNSRSKLGLFAELVNRLVEVSDLERGADDVGLRRSSQYVERRNRKRG